MSVTNPMAEPAEILPDDYIATVVRDARRYQGQWTGTAGNLAAHCMRLVRERERMLEANKTRVAESVGQAAVIEQAWEKYRRAGPQDRRVYGSNGDQAAVPATGTKAEQLLATALDVVRERRGTYGPPGEHFRRTVGLVNALFAGKLREPLTEADWAQVMILDKLARHQGEKKNADTPVDLAGYAACLAEVET